MDSPEFDIDRSIASAWEEFTDRLAEVVSVIDDGDSLTLGTSSTEPAPFIRFTHLEGEPDRVMMEACPCTSGQRHRLFTDGECEALVGAGWERPRPGAECFSRIADQEDAPTLAALATDTLWNIVGVQHPVFLAPDQLAEVLTLEGAADDPAAGETSAAVSPTPPSGRELVAVMPRDRAHLDELVAEEFSHLYGHPPVRDADGDITIRVGSGMVFVRTSPQADEVVLFSPIVHDVEGRSRATEVLNDLNVEARRGRFALHRDRVLVSTSLPAKPFVPAHLHQAVEDFNRLVDEIDELLAEKLRGRTTFSDPA